MRMRENRTVPFFVIAISISVYFSALFHGFVWDDNEFIINNPFTHDWKNLATLFTHSYLKLSWHETDVSRPIMLVSLFADYAIWGLNPFGYHLTNLILHTLNSIILLALLKALFPNSAIPLTGAIIFSVHTIHTEAVNAISFREDLLVALFCLLSLYLFIKGFIANSRKAWAFSLLSYLFALLSKEMALTFPLIVLLLYLTLLKRKYFPKWLFAGYLVLTLIYTTWLFYIQQYSDLHIPPENLMPLSKRLYGNISAIGHYLWLHIFPFNLNPLYPPNLFITKPLQDAVITMSAIVLTLWIFFKSTPSPGAAVFSMGWFFITLIPVTNVIPLLHPVAERYLYLPSIGPIILMALLLDRLLHTSNKKPIIYCIVALIAAFASLTTIKRNAVWENSVHLWEDTVIKSPKNPIARNNLGWSYLQDNRLDEALREVQLAIKLKPDYPGAHNNLGAIYERKGMQDSALIAYQTAITLKPDYSEAHNNLGVIYEDREMIGEALQEYQAALALKPALAEAYYNTGNIYYKQGLFEEALNQYTLATRLKPTLVGPYFKRGNILFELNRLEEAVTEFQAALKINPDVPETRYNLGVVYLELGRDEEAAGEFDLALKLRPGYTSAQQAMEILRSSDEKRF